MSFNINISKFSGEQSSPPRLRASKPKLLIIDIDSDFISDNTKIEVYTDKNEYFKIETKQELMYIPDNASNYFIKVHCTYNEGKETEKFVFYNSLIKENSKEELEESKHSEPSVVDRTRKKTSGFLRDFVPSNIVGTKPINHTHDFHNIISINAL